MDVRVMILLALEGITTLFFLWKLGFMRSIKAVLICTSLLSIALLLRLCCFDRENTDYEWFLKVWIEFFRENNGLKGLGRSIGNYNVPYLFFLALFEFNVIQA